MFSCQHKIAHVIAWTLNGSLINEKNLSTGIKLGMTLDENGHVVRTLTIKALINYNETEVECLAIFAHNSMPDERTPPVKLLIQGKFVQKNIID